MKKNLTVLYLMSAVLALGVLISGCTNSSPVEQAVICSKITQAGEPEIVANTFAPDVSSIYCSVKLKYTSIKSSVKAEWYLVSSEEAADLKNSLIGEGSVIAGTTYVVLQFTRSDKLLPRGDYEVKLFYDNVPIQTLPFKIQGEAAPSAASLTDITMCTSLDLLTEKPLDRVDVFPSDISKIYCSARLENGNFNSIIRARWIYIGGEMENLKGKVIYEPQTKAEGREYISFSIGMQPGKQMPSGQYSITLFVDGREQAKIPFSVVPISEIKWPYISEMSTFAYTDADHKDAVLTAKFPDDTREANFRAKLYNAPEGTELTIKWILDRSADTYIQEKLLKEDKSTVSGTLEIRASMSTRTEPFVKGDYLVKVLINGEEKVSYPFVVK